jgi:hypothetical protein
MKKFSFSYLLTFAFLTAFLVGCAQLGVPATDTFNKKLLAGYSSVTAVRNTATTLLVAKQITPKDAQNIQVQADAARGGLDIASSLKDTDFKAAEDRLTVSLTILQGIQTYLNSRSNK